MDERLDAVGFDLLLGVDAQLFADLDLDRQAVRVPAGLALAAVAAHGAVAGEQVFDGPGEAVAGMRHAVGRRRAFVKDEPAAGAGRSSDCSAVRSVRRQNSPISASSDGKMHRAVDGLKHRLLALVCRSQRPAVNQPGAVFSIGNAPADAGTAGERHGASLPVIPAPTRGDRVTGRLAPCRSPGCAHAAGATRPNSCSMAGSSTANWRWSSSTSSE